MNNCGVKIDEDGDEVCHCCQPPHYKIVSTEPWCVCDDNGNHHGYTGLNGVFVCCPAPPEGRPQPIRVGYECGQGCTGCCPNGTIYNIGSDDAGYPIEGCCEEPNKALPFSCCASGQEPVQNIDIYGNRIMRQMDACCPEGYATQAINGQCCSGEVYQNANSGNYECCPEGSTVSNGICCEAGKTGVPNYNSSGTQIGSFCCPAGTDNTSYVGAINGSCCGGEINTLQSSRHPCPGYTDEPNPISNPITWNCEWSWFMDFFGNQYQCLANTTCSKPNYVEGTVRTWYTSNAFCECITWCHTGETLYCMCEDTEGNYSYFEE